MTADVRALVFPLAALLAFLSTIPVVVVTLMSVILSGAPLSFAMDELRSLIMYGLRRKRRVWGVVYDAHTKAPIAYAKVELRDAANRVLETRYADRQGRYGFLTSPASLREQAVSISLVASVNGYRFPSLLVNTDPDFIVYDHVYRGGIVSVSGNVLVNYNIPLDPVSDVKRVNPQPFLSGFTVRLLDVAFWAGLIILPLNAVLSPSWWSIGLLAVFIVTNAFRIGQNLYRPFGIVLDATSRGMMPFALVTLNESSGQRVNFTVSDEHGRYILSGERGRDYELQAYTPSNVVPQRSHSFHVNGHSRIGRRAWFTLTMKI